jgi:hypothetical protein
MLIPLFILKNSFVVLYLGEMANLILRICMGGVICGLDLMIVDVPYIIMTGRYVLVLVLV